MASAVGEKLIRLNHGCLRCRCIVNKLVGFHKVSFCAATAQSESWG